MIQIEVVRLYGWSEICRITEALLPEVSNLLSGMRSARPEFIRGWLIEQSQD